MDAALSSGLHRPARRLLYGAHCRDFARFLFQSRGETIPICPGGGTFALSHSGHAACGIPDGETIVMTGGYDHSLPQLAIHNFVTRCSWELGGAV